MIDLKGVEPATYFASGFRDIDSYDAALARQVEHLQKARGRAAQIRAQLEVAPSRPCPFCPGEQRDLSVLGESRDDFGHIGGTYSSLERARDNLKLVPRQWECQRCGAFDANSPGAGTRTWSRAQPPGPHSVARQILDAFASVDGVALIEDAHGTHWMLLVAGAWYVLPGTSSQVVQRLLSRGVL